MEKKKDILQADIKEGFYIQIDCAMCRTEVTFGGFTKKDVQEQLKEQGWKYLYSDIYQLEGYHCGCEYK